MQAFIKRHWFTLAVAVLVLAIAAALAAKYGAGKSPYKVIKPAPNFQLSNIDGSPVTLTDTTGKVRLVYFYFSYCADVCPATTYMLSKVQDYLMEKGYWGNRTALYSITFDPVRDTPERLKQFSSQFVKDPSGWYFLRGEEAATKELARQYGVIVEKDKDGNFIHSNMVILVDKDNNIRNYYYAENAEFDPYAIAQDMIRLYRE
jgi:protein SCO1/2